MNEIMKSLMVLDLDDLQGHIPVARHQERITPTSLSLEKNL